MVGQTAILREAVGLFHDPEKLHAAVSELQSSGFDRAEISLLAREGILDPERAILEWADRRPRRAPRRTPAAMSPAAASVSESAAVNRGA